MAYETVRLFTDAFLKEDIHRPGNVGVVFYDTKCTGLQARAGKNRKVAMAVRAYVHKKRETEKLGRYHPETNDLETVRIRAYAQLGAWDTDVIKPKVTKSLEEMMDYYRERRLANDGLILARCDKEGLPDAWDGLVIRLKKILKSILHVRIDKVTREMIVEEKDKYLRARLAEQGLTLKAGEALNDATIRAPFSCLSSILFYAQDLGWITPNVNRGLCVGGWADRERYPLPGEWQRIAKVIDAIPHDAGMFLRFLQATGVRFRNALDMRWSDLYEKEELLVEISPEGEAITATTRDWRLMGTEMKGKRSKRFTLIGESIRIIDHFAKQKEETEDPRETVFPEEVIKVWRDNAPYYQRLIEEAACTAEFHRNDLRRMMATYLGYAGLSDGHISIALAHAIGKGKSSGPKMADVTKVYKRNARQTFGPEEREVIENDSDLMIARAMLRSQKLLRDIEAGNLSPLVERTLTKIRKEDTTLDMFGDYENTIDPIKLLAPDAFARWQKAAKLDAWGAGLKEAVLAARRAVKANAKAKKGGKAKAEFETVRRAA